MNVLHVFLILCFTQILFDHVHASLEEEIEEWNKDQHLLAKTRLSSVTSIAAGTLFALQKDCTEILEQAQHNLKRVKYRLESELSELEDAGDDNEDIEKCVKILKAQLDNNITFKSVNACVTEARYKGSTLDRQMAEIIIETQNIITANQNKAKECDSVECFSEVQNQSREENEHAISKAVKFAERSKDLTVSYGKKMHECIQNADENIRIQFIAIENEMKNCSKIIKKDEL